ncbi:morphogenic membrane protein MmpB [Streptomyces mayteni]
MLWSDLAEPSDAEGEYGAARAMLRRAGWVLAVAAPLVLLLLSR